MTQPSLLVLGPIVVVTPEGLVSPGGPTTRAVLCSLVVGAGRAVPCERLMYDVWGDDAPGLHALQSHITRLRKVLGSDRLIFQGGSYRLLASPGDIDSRRFEQLVDSARRAGSPEEVRRICLEAFELWRGVPFADLADRDFLRLEVERLEDVRLSAIEMCVEADLALGRQRQIIGSLRAAVSEFPFHERMWGYLMRALDEVGRQAEALAAYDQVETLLAAELGIEPSNELQGLRRAMAAA